MMIANTSGISPLSSGSISCLSATAKSCVCARSTTEPMTIEPRGFFMMRAVGLAAEQALLQREPRDQGGDKILVPLDVDRIRPLSVSSVVVYRLLPHGRSVRLTNDGRRFRPLRCAGAT
jgi:hypothetical protein